MILNISGRTDIVQYYTEWLLNGFDAGFVYSRNPMFCSKNYKPTFPHLERFAHKFCENSKRHSPDSPPLLGNLNDTDIVTECREQSLLKPKDNTLRPDL